jgi:hypothetical protein
VTQLALTGIKLKKSLLHFLKNNKIILRYAKNKKNWVIFELIWKCTKGSIFSSSLIGKIQLLCTSAKEEEAGVWLLPNIDTAERKNQIGPKCKNKTIFWMKLAYYERKQISKGSHEKTLLYK